MDHDDVGPVGMIGPRGRAFRRVTIPWAFDRGRSGQRHESTHSPEDSGPAIYRGKSAGRRHSVESALGEGQAAALRASLAVVANYAALTGR